jgi:hypothetical protein
MCYVVSGQLGRTAFVIWLLNILFFSGCVFHVHMRIRVLAVKKARWSLADRFRCGSWNLIFHVLMIVILLLVVFERWTSSLVLLAFVPITTHAVWGTVKLTSDPDFRKLGLTLLGHSVVFMMLMLVVLR